MSTLYSGKETGSFSNVVTFRVKIKELGGKCEVGFRDSCDLNFSFQFSPSREHPNCDK